MTPSQFVSSLRSTVVEENTALYRQLFTDTRIENVTDPYWKRALSFFNALSLEQQEGLFEIIRQVAVDTTSNILGVIDGVNELEGVNEQFNLSSEKGEKLSGELQSMFLLQEEQSS